MWHWFAQGRNFWTKHSSLQRNLVACELTRCLRRYASRKSGPCAGMRSHLDAMGNRHSKWTKKTQLPDEIKRTLDGQRQTGRGFVLNTFRFLSETQENKFVPAGACICWSFHHHPRLLCRLSDSNPTKSGSASKDMETTEEDNGVFELWSRVRTFFRALASTSVDQHEWFGCGESEQFVDQVFKWRHLRSGGQRSPNQFYIEAFSTCAACQTAVRPIEY